MICSLADLQQNLKLNQAEQGQYIDFQFPNKLFSTYTFKDRNQITKNLKSLGRKFYFLNGRVFKGEIFDNENGAKVVFHCKNKECKARLIYHKEKNGPFYQSIVFQNLHHHKRSKDPEKAKRQEINLFIMQLRGAQYEQFKKTSAWSERFNMDNKQAHMICEQVFWSNNTEDDTLLSLTYENAIIRRVKEGEQTLLIFLGTPSMREMYSQFGDAIYFETFHETSKRRINGQYNRVGYFFAQDYNLRLVLVGVIVIEREDSATYMKVLQIFFEAICQGKIPKSIITDQCSALTMAINQIKKQKGYDMSHVYSWYHMTQKFMKILKPLANRQSIMKLMCQTMQETNQQAYFSLLGELKSNLNENFEIFKYFQRHQHKFCLRRIQKKFIGFAISTTFGEKIYEYVSNPGVYRIHPARFLLRLFKSQKQFLTKMQKVTKICQPVIRYFPPELNQIRIKLQAKLMQILLQNYNKSRMCVCQTLTPTTIKITQQSGHSFLCTFSVPHDHWQCECEQLERTGMPCPHLICLLMGTDVKACLSYYVNERWFHDKKMMVEYVRGTYITNKSRKRR